MSELGDREDRFVEDQRRIDDQYYIDTIAHYRNLSIMLGAKPNQMLNKYDAWLAERGVEDDGVDPLDGIVQTWEQLELADALLAEAAEVLQEFPHQSLAHYALAIPEWWQTKAQPLLDKLGERE